MSRLVWSNIAPKGPISTTHASASLNDWANSPCLVTWISSHALSYPLLGSRPSPGPSPVCTGHACFKSGCHKFLSSKECLITSTCHADQCCLLHQPWYGLCHGHAYNNRDVLDAILLLRTLYLFPAIGIMYMSINWFPGTL